MSSVSLNGDTSGSVILEAADVAGSTTITIAAQSGTLNVGGPAFSATSNSYQTGVPTTTWTKCALSVEQFDTNSNFDSVTNYRFTPTVAGYYLITGTVTDNNTASPTRLIGKIYKNGSGYYYTGGDVVTGYNTTGTAVIYFNGSTDYVELYVYIGAGGATGIESMMTGCFLRGA